MRTPFPPENGTRGSDRVSVGVVIETRHYREALVATLSKEMRLSVLDLGPGGPGSLKRLLDARPDLLLIDLPPSRLGSFVREAHRESPTLRVIAVNLGEDEEELLSLFELGMTAFVTRDSAFDEIFAAIRDALRGEFHCPPRMAAALVRRLNVRGTNQKHLRTTRLTPREEQVLRLLGEGLTNKEISSRLGLEPSTIKNHVHSILHKLSIHRRGDAVMGSRAEEPGLRIIPLKDRARRGGKQAPE